MQYRAGLALLIVPALIILLSLVKAADFTAQVEPNTSIEAGSGNILFNFTINNTNATVNITAINITLPPGFAFISGSNQSSANLSLFQNTSLNLSWTNSSQPGIISNLSQEWFAFNSSVNTTPGTYNFTVTVLDVLNTTNSTVVQLQVNDTVLPANLISVSPTPENNSWSNQSWFMVNITFEELNPNTCLLELENGTGQNWTMQRLGSYCWLNASNQSSGSLNFSVWVNDTSGNLAWNGTWYLNIGAVPHDLEPGSNMLPNGSVTNNDWFFVNFTFSEDSPDTCLLNLNNGTQQQLNMTTNTTQGFCFLNVTSQGEGHWNYTFWMNNTQGASNQTGPFYVSVDLTPTIISNITAAPDYNTALISWNTSFPANSAVFYGIGSEANLTMNVTNSTLDTIHSLLLDNLSMNTKYFYNVTSCDNLSICNTSGTFNFTTLCIESWSYGSWGTCSNGQQSRSATDLNSCGTTDNRSAVVRSCDEGDGGGGGGGGGETHPTVTKIWRSIFPDVPAVMTIDRPGISATSLTIEVSELQGTSNAVVRGYSSTPSEIKEPPPGRVHSYLNITTSISRTAISSIIIEFSVERAWIESNEINVSTVRLMRLVQNWTALDTILVASENESLRFRATGAGLSWFAVTGHKYLNESEAVPEPSEERPPEEAPEGEAPAPPEGPSEMGDVCRAGERRCVAGYTIQVCNSQGSGWLDDTTCLYGCYRGECTTTFVVQIDLNQILMALAALAVIVALAIVYTKRRAISDFIFWRL